MKTFIKTLVAGAMAIAMSVGSADAQSKKGTPTCKGDDNLVRLTDGRQRCWEKGKELPKGAVVIDKTPAKAAPVATKDRATFARFAEAAEGCLKEADALSTGPGVPGGFVGKDGQMHFTSPNEDLAAKCIAVGNAANRPERWK